MIRRRLQYTVMLFSLVPTLLAFIASAASGVDIQIEIFYLPHPPALAVVSEVEKVAAEFKEVTITKYIFDDPDVAKLLKKYSLTDHMPVAIFINGQNNFTVNGQKIGLQNFPKGNTFVPTFAGAWDYNDLRIILQEISGVK
jgi:hypothetical protein